MRTSRLETDDCEEVFYKFAGRGKPVLLIHGFTMWSEMWTTNGVVRVLCDDHKVIIPDLRGHGLSSRPHGRSGYGLKLLDDMAAILDREATEKVAIVGFSLGAELTLKLATTMPSRISSVFLIGSGWTRENGVALYREFASWARENRAGLTPRPDYDAFDALAEGMSEIIDVPKDELEQVRVPCSGLVGGDDPEHVNLEALRGVIPGFELAVLPGVPHETSWRDPSVPDRVRSFIDCT